jgi:hypothetical protein
VQTAAQTLRANPKFDAEKAITELGVGEALVSFLDEKGTPTIVERAFVLPPSSRIGPLTADERAAAINSSVLFGHYEAVVDRESAYEKLKGAAPKVSDGGTPSAPPAAAESSSGGMFGGLGGAIGSILAGSTGPRGGHNAGVVEMAAKSAARAIGSQVGREIIRGVLGSILGGRSR